MPPWAEHERSFQCFIFTNASNAVARNRAAAGPEVNSWRQRISMPHGSGSFRGRHYIDGAAGEPGQQIRLAQCTVEGVVHMGVGA